jgi:hypothetical protein
MDPYRDLGRATAAAVPRSTSRRRATQPARTVAAVEDSDGRRVQAGAADEDGGEQRGAGRRAAGDGRAASGRRGQGRRPAGEGRGQRRPVRTGTDYEDRGGPPARAGAAGRRPARAAAAGGTRTRSGLCRLDGHGAIYFN